MSAGLRAGYKQTEVGVIPEDWDVAALGDLGQCLIGLTYKPSNMKDHGTLVLRSSNVHNGELAFDDCVYVDAEIPDRIRVQDGDILVCVRNGSRALIGKSAVLDLRVVGQTFGAFMSVFRTIDSALIFQHFNSDLIKRQISENIGATINQITNANLNSFKVPLPRNRSERVTIATALSDVDALLAKLDEFIAKKRDLKQAAMQQLLTGQTRLPGFSGEWEVRRLGEVLKVRHGRSQHEVAVASGSYPILATGGEIGRTNAFLYDKPSVLIGRKGTIDKPQYQDSPFWTVDTLFYTELFNSVHPKFIYFKFLLIDWRSYNEASGVPSLNASTIESIQIVVPDLDEQTAIATILSDMDAELAALQARRDKTRALKQGMMQELLTGRIRLLAN